MYTRDFDMNISNVFYREYLVIRRNLAELISNPDLKKDSLWQELQLEQNKIESLENIFVAMNKNIRDSQKATPFWNQIKAAAKVYKNYYIDHQQVSKLKENINELEKAKQLNQTLPETFKQLQEGYFTRKTTALDEMNKIYEEIIAVDNVDKIDSNKVKNLLSDLKALNACYPNDQIFTQKAHNFERIAGLISATAEAQTSKTAGKHVDHVLTLIKASAEVQLNINRVSSNESNKHDYKACYQTTKTQLADENAQQDQKKFYSKSDKFKKLLQAVEGLEPEDKSPKWGQTPN
jgi:hypothetical protein